MVNTATVNSVEVNAAPAAAGGAEQVTVTETVILGAQALAQGDVDVSVSENLDIAFTIVGSVHDTRVLTDALTVSDALGVAYGASLADTLAFAEVLAISAGGSVTISETLELVHTIVGEAQRFENRTEAFNMGDALSFAYGGTVNEPMLWADTVLSNATLNAQLTEQIKLITAMRLSWELIVSEDINLTSSEAHKRAAEGLIQDICAITDIPSAAVEVYNTLLVAMELASTQGYAYELALLEAMGLVSAETSAIAARETLSESAVFGDASSARLGLIAVAEDGFSIDDDIDAKGVLQASAQEQLTFAITFSDGEENYTAWAMNVRNFAVTEYENYRFNSFAKVGGSFLAAGPEGLYRVEGGTDNGSEIDWLIRTGKIDPGRGQKSRMEYCYLGVRSSGKIVIKTITGDEVVNWYETDAARDGLDAVRTKFGRGAKSRYWQWELVNIDGADLELENIQLFPAVLSRRI